MVLALALAGCGSPFTDAEVQSVREAIRAEYSRREGVTVVEVRMERESSTKLKGFVKLQAEIEPGVMQVLKTCSATKSDGRPLWSCH